MSLLPVGIGSEEGGYQIERSLRFNSADSAYLNRTPASAGNRTTWTWSGWVKRSGSGGSMFAAYTSGTNRLRITFASDKIQLFGEVSGSSVEATTTAVYRDYSAWYHIVVALDTTQATNTNRIKVYVNGVQVTSFSATTYPSQNADLEINNNSGHYIGQRGDNADYFNGYLTEINFIDGSALTPTSFGEFNSDTGVWQPKAYTGSYGTNGFYLNFSDNSGTTSTTLGKDSSGNGNNWTPNNFSVTAGSGNDSLVDSPTRYGTDTGAGGEVRGNYATLNPLGGSSGGLQGTLTNGNLTWTSPATDQRCVLSTMQVNSNTADKWYWEVTATSKTSNFWAIGVFPYNINQYSASSGYAMYRSDGAIYVNGPNVDTVASYTAGDVIGLAFNASNNELSWYKNNVLQTTETVSNSAGFAMYAGAGSDSSGGSNVNDFNFGQRPFAYTAPSGFKALVTTNLPTPTIEDGEEYFNTVLYTGTGSTRSVSGVGFQPDFLWIKSRSASANHALYDVIRGGTNALRSSTTGAEAQYGDAVITYQTDGFQIAGTNVGGVNGSSESLVAWNWKANGAGVSNTAGTITSTVSANTDSGFSIVTYTGTGANATVGHGLGVAPRMILIKERSQSRSWVVYHNSVGATAFLQLDTTASATTSSAVFNNTAPTSAVFSLGTSIGTNQSSETYVAYCFAPVAGYSAFGSYTGNGSADGPFVYLGFRPRYVMVKLTSSSGQEWCIQDSSRLGYNPDNAALFADLSAAEYAANLRYVDFTSNGFKIRNSTSNQNASGGTYIYMAFAENPFSIALAR